VYRQQSAVQEMLESMRLAGLLLVRSTHNDGMLLVQPLTVNDGCFSVAVLVIRLRLCYALQPSIPKCSPVVAGGKER